MIHPESIDLFSLPSVPLCKKSELPEIPCIYFAIDNLGVVQYIGRTTNIKSRWIQHHRYSELKLIGNIKIAYISVDTPELLPEIEKALITWFNPVLNVTGYKPTMLKDKAKNKKVYCNLKQLMEKQQLNIAQLSKQVGIREDTLRGYIKNYFERIDCETIIVLCKFFNVSMDEMFVIKEG